MLWGFFKKMVIADRAAILVNQVFGGYESYAGFTLLLGALLYALQIYTDFSGCVDIARGAAEAFQIHLPHNFNQPYLATSIKDFWRRWHISLSSWSGTMSTSPWAATARASSENTSTSWPPSW